MTRLRAKHFENKRKKRPREQAQKHQPSRKTKAPTSIQLLWVPSSSPTLLFHTNSTFWQCCRSTLTLQSKLEHVWWVQEYVKIQSYGQNHNEIFFSPAYSSLPSYTVQGTQLFQPCNPVQMHSGYCFLSPKLWKLLSVFPATITFIVKRMLVKAQI
jgi:hypothetical protein